MNSEAIFAALFGLLSESAAFQTSSRRLRHWTDVSFAEQPSLFVTQRKGNGKATRSNLPSIFTLEGDAWIYAHSNDPSVPPSSILNPLFDAVVNAISPKVGAFGGAQTLGGLVTSCHVDGEIMYDEGLLGDQAVCKIPISILVPG